MLGLLEKTVDNFLVYEREMCGDSSRISQGGALAVLSLPYNGLRRTDVSSAPILAGYLLFHRGGGECSPMATHASLKWDSSFDHSMIGNKCVVGIQ
jgi:hypothetical protein